MDANFAGKTCRQGVQPIWREAEVLKYHRRCNGDVRAQPTGAFK
jgi:hypothetical protein